MTQTFSPGSIVHARGREWIVLNGSSPEVLRVRPVAGAEHDQTLIHLGLEAEPVREASFPLPTLAQTANHDSALLLRDALLLSLRRGCGPFRSFGQIAVEPRAYQLVPLLMALKQDTVRLLVADDVGIGKTIEGALIARELLDRGDIDRTTVLCPPHLVEQWVGELATRFHMQAVAVTASSATRLERGLLQSESIFAAYPHTVVSLDYIKSERRRAEFLRACPNFVIVDEAHSCAGGGQGRHQRFELLRGLAENPARHMVLLTATPHSGDEAAFYRLLGLLHPDFATLADTHGSERTELRARLANYFVQRRRPDIKEWQQGGAQFPRRETTELTYKLTGAWETLLTDVLSYCANVVASAQGDSKRERLSFWSTLSLMRCVASSPAAAAQALRNRAVSKPSNIAIGNEIDLDNADYDEALVDQVFDGTADALPDNEAEVAVASADPALAKLVAQAEELAGTEGDPKLKLLVDHLRKLLADGFNPVVFCRFIPSAHYLGRHLQREFADTTVVVVTGELTSGERLERIDQLGEAESRLLIATDCLSEGVNLQQSFDAVVHYDLSWNPTRHEQREGRVDRFGQPKPVVRTTLIYGANNPVDGAVLQVILRKAEKIREELGVPVPLPDDGHSLTQALLKAVLLRGGIDNQLSFELLAAPQAAAIEAKWQDAAAKAKKNQTIFAQRALKPDEVLPEWHKTLTAIGSSEDVFRFTDRALVRLGAGLDKRNKKDWSIGAKLAISSSLPAEITDRLQAAGLAGTLHLNFNSFAVPGCQPVVRSHPLVSVLAESLLEHTLSTAAEASARSDSAAQTTSTSPADPIALGRLGIWATDAVTTKTTVVLLRLRHQLVVQRQQGSSTLLVEEASAIAWSGANGATQVAGDEALALLSAPPTATPPQHVRDRQLALALAQVADNAQQLAAYAQSRAQELLADHRRVREAADSRGKYSVKPLIPVDAIGIFVLLPKVG